MTILTLSISIFLPLSLARSRARARAHTPVSYTHLDVYKRQTKDRGLTAKVLIT